MVKVGERVFAIMDADEDAVRLFGVGVYDGEHVPDPSEDVRFFGMIMESPNPRMTLDNGERVYGCECWWGAEDKLQEIVAGRRVEPVSIVEMRKQYREETQ